MRAFCHGSCFSGCMETAPGKSLTPEGVELQTRGRIQAFTVGRPGVVAEPAEARDAFAEFARDGRREPGVDVFETALPGVALGVGVERADAFPTFARSAGARIE